MEDRTLISSSHFRMLVHRKHVRFASKKSKVNRLKRLACPETKVVGHGASLPPQDDGSQPGPDRRVRCRSENDNDDLVRTGALSAGGTEDAGGRAGGDCTGVVKTRQASTRPSLSRCCSRCRAPTIVFCCLIDDWLSPQRHCCLPAPQLRRCGSTTSTFKFAYWSLLSAPAHCTSNGMGHACQSANSSSFR